MSEDKMRVAADALTEALERLKLAQDALQSAEQKEQIASSATTTARNEVNAIHKEIDELMKDLKGSASWNTEWHQQRRRGENASHAADISAVV